MGLPMAKNLNASLTSRTDKFVLYDRDATTRSQVTKTFDNSVKMLSAPDECPSQVDVVISMLPNSEHVEGLYLDQLRHLSKNETRLLIDCSTIDPARSIRVSEQCAKLGIGQFVDAPVSGGVKGAESGSLSFMIGRPDDCAIRDRLESVLWWMGKTMHFCGEGGSGLVAKLVNNYLLALNNLATCEAMHLGSKMGLDSQVLGRVVNSSTGKCWPSERNNPVLGITPGAPVERDFEGGFGIELMMKDLGLARKMAEDAGLVLGSGEAAMEVYQEASKQFRGKDFGVVLKHLERLSI